jgi:hypothetical protein
MKVLKNKGQILQYGNSMKQLPIVSYFIYYDSGNKCDQFLKVG